MMKILLTSLAILLLAAMALAQNGPTPASVSLAWTQGAASAASGAITANCVYRSTVSGTPVTPAIYCSTVPITSWTDTTVVRGTTYNYWVTCKFSASEGPYSNMVTASIPVTSTPPVLNPPVVTQDFRPSPPNHKASVRLTWRQGRV